MIKLVASDMDGTLLPDYGQAVDPEIYTIIEKLKARGIRFMAASGRQYWNLRQHFLPVADDIDYLCENGGLVFRGGELIVREQMEEAYARELIDTILTTPRYKLLISGVHTCYILKGDPDFHDFIEKDIGNKTTLIDDPYCIPEAYFKISAWKEDEKTVVAEMPYWNGLFSDRLTSVYSGKGWVDFSPLGVTKGTAITKYMAQCGLKKEEVMAFGDNYNDEDMLNNVEYSFAMREAPREIREFTYGTTDSVKETLKNFFKEFL